MVKLRFMDGKAVIGSQHCVFGRKQLFRDGRIICKSLKSCFFIS